MLLKLTYKYKSDAHNSVTVIGSPRGIRDLYWQLTRNYRATNGTEIGVIEVSNLDGTIIDAGDLMSVPFNDCTQLDRGNV